MHSGRFRYAIDPKVFSKFSSTITIYFYFLKFVIFLCLFNLIFYGIFGVIIIIQNDTIRDCFFTTCAFETDFASKFDKNANKVLIALNIFILIFFKYLFFFWVRKFNLYIDEELITPGDFTIHMKGLRKDYDHDVLRDLITKYFVKKGGTVKKVNLIFDIKDHVEFVRAFGLAKRK